MFCEKIMLNANAFELHDIKIERNEGFQHILIP